MARTAWHSAGRTSSRDAHLLFTPLLFNFGDQPTGSTATPQSITVTNTAGTDVTSRCEPRRRCGQQFLDQAR
ncbi:MAG: hypothetical protein U0841_08070 [Chloroflexia bacterium]